MYVMFTFCWNYDNPISKTINEYIDSNRKSKIILLLFQVWNKCAFEILEVWRLAGVRAKQQGQANRKTIMQTLSQREKGYNTHRMLWYLQLLFKRIYYVYTNFVQVHQLIWIKCRMPSILNVQVLKLKLSPFSSMFWIRNEI